MTHEDFQKIAPKLTKNLANVFIEHPDALASILAPKPAELIEQLLQEDLEEINNVS